MQEYITKAIVLNTKRRGEQDKEISFFSERFGKFRAVLVSGYKTTSKFAPHCDVLDYVMVRVVYKNRYTVTDIIAEKKYAQKLSSINVQRAFLLTHFLDKNLPDEVPDHELWERMVHDCNAGDILFAHYFSHLGYGGTHATCGRCGAAAPWAFFFGGQEFLCKSCGSHVPENELLLV